MPRFRCEKCGFETQDETLPECPLCGGYLREVEEEAIPQMSEVDLEDEENMWGFNA
ncbi:hypothetical protein J7L13_02660 [bacterium]|nr:hypothetical protein [bacterium]